MAECPLTRPHYWQPFRRGLTLKTLYRLLVYSFFLVCLLLAATAASAQTLLVVQPASQTTTSKRLSDLHGGNGDPVRGPTEIPRHLLNGNGNGSGAPGQPDAVLQSSPGPLINATGGLSFDGASV